MRRQKTDPTKGLMPWRSRSANASARSLLDLLAAANINLREGVDPTLIERERAVAKQLNDKARTQTTTPEQAAALKQEISQLENDYERAQVAIRKASPRYAALTQPQPLKLREIQAQLDADTLLLEYTLGEERSYLWAISKDSLKSYGAQGGIRQSAVSVKRCWRAALRRRSALDVSSASRKQKLNRAARALSQTVLAVAAEQQQAAGHRRRRRPAIHSVCVRQNRHDRQPSISNRQSAIGNQHR
jgi:hypothetical protein